ncbi:MAG: hypothetical protein EXS35_03110 [Pedosphaera sp.]|nr:hypothetical protein [Pedosphaera sp.]
MDTDWPSATWRNRPRIEPSNTSLVTGCRSPMTCESCIHSHGARRLKSSAAAAINAFQVSGKTRGTAG